MYKLIALDMDGTLLREDKTISDRTKEAIEKARMQGAKVVLATGRPIDGVRAYLEELGLTTEGDYVISYNGALVENVGTKEVISHVLVNGADVRYLYHIAKELGVHIHALSHEGCVTPQISRYSELESEINGIGLVVKDFETFDVNEELPKIMMIDEPALLEEAIKKLPAEVYEKYTVVRSAPFFLEFLNPKVNKGEGVRALAEKLGIDPSEVICVGDAGNDKHMIEYAGLGVAMGNAFEEIKAIADFVTKSNEDDGVAYVIEEFMLK
ncbi:MAG: sugar-phosphatase [Cellulosilyticaceae bacterium]